MAYDINHLATVGQLKTVALRMKEGLDGTIKSLSVSGNTISFFTSDDGTGTAAYTVDFPKDLFLDQARTRFEGNFTFAAATYPGATNPNLDNKPVMVLAVKGTTDPANGTASDTITYSFLDMSTLVDTYTVKSGDSAKVLVISGYEIEFKVSSAANNALTVQNDGLHVDISGKTDKVTNATAGHVASLDANGNLLDSGVIAENVVTTADIATSAEVTEMLGEVFGD